MSRAYTDLHFRTHGAKELKEAKTTWTELNQSLELFKKGLEVVNRLTDAGIKGISQFVGVGSKIEGWTVQFKALLGSEAEALSKMEDLKRVAGEMPFTLEAVTDSAALLEAYGAGATVHLEAAADMAASFNRDIGDASQALASAFAGEFEPLKRYGVLVDDIRNKLGHELVRDTKEGMQEIGNAVSEIFRDRAGGAAKDFAKTFQGIISMLEDAWFQFKTIVSDAGVFDAVRSIFGSVLTTVQELFNSGKAKNFGEIVGDTISHVLWEVAEALARSADWLMRIAEKLGYEGPTTKTERLEAELKALNDELAEFREKGPKAFDWRRLFETDRDEFGLGLLIKKKEEEIQAYLDAVDGTFLGGIQKARREWDQRRIEAKAGGGPEEFVPIDWAAELQGQSMKPGTPGTFGMGGDDYGPQPDVFGFTDEEYQSSVDAITDAYDAKESLLNKWQVSEEAVREGSYAAWSAYYSQLELIGRKYYETETFRLKDIAKVVQYATAMGVSAFLAAKSVEWGALAAEAWAYVALDIAKGQWVLAGKAAEAGVKFTALATMYGVGAGVAAASAGQGVTLPDTSSLEDAEEAGRDRGTRRRGGGASTVRSQSITFQVFVVHEGTTYYGGADGARQFWTEELLPLAQESYEMGDLG